MADAKKCVFKVDLKGARDKHKAFKAISGIEGVDSISLDTKDNKLTVIGNVDPVVVVAKLRKCWYASIISVGPAKEPEKKKEEAKKDEEKKEKSKEDEQVAELVKTYRAYNPQVSTSYYVQSAEENPNYCVIM